MSIPVETMTSKATSKARRFHEAIHKARLPEWDPIGVREFSEARDEYDAYVPIIYTMLTSRPSLDDMFTYLWRLETEHMGLKGDRKATKQFAQPHADFGRNWRELSSLPRQPATRPSGACISGTSRKRRFSGPLLICMVLPHDG